MKCPHCGGQMGIEDNFCTHCGSRNKLALQHQSEMEHYQKEYQRTKSTVLEKAGLLQRYGSWLIVLVVMLLALVAAIILQARAWDIGYRLREKEVTRQRQTHIAAVESLLEQGDYGQFQEYYSANDLYMADIEGYDIILAASRGYAQLMEYISALHDSNHYRFREEHRASGCEDIATALIRIYTAEKDVWREDDPAFAEDKMAHVREIRDRTAHICKTYFHLTDEDIAAIPDLSTGKLGETLERRIYS